MGRGNSHEMDFWWTQAFVVIFICLSSGYSRRRRTIFWKYPHFRIQKDSLCQKGVHSFRSHISTLRADKRGVRGVPGRRRQARKSRLPKISRWGTKHPPYGIPNLITNIPFRLVLWVYVFVVLCVIRIFAKKGVSATHFRAHDTYQGYDRPPCDACTLYGF